MARTPFLRAAWRQIAMLNFDVPHELLLPLVPQGTELDFFEGRTMASVVGFRFENTRVKGFGIPFHRNFDEVNLRFYVKHQGKRGVVFIKEIVPLPMIAWVARTVYNEPYVALPMRSNVRDGKDVRYAWRFSRRLHSLQVTVEGEPQFPAPNSEEEFIAEHYWGYTRQRDGSTLEYEVEHPQWRVWRAQTAELDCDVFTMYGEQFVPYLTKPCSAFLAEGSEIVVYEGQPLSV